MLPQIFRVPNCALMAAATAAVLLGATAHAQSTVDPSAAASEPLWEVRLAGFGRNGPAYPASSESQVDIVPLPFPIYRGRFLRIGDDTEKPVRTRLFRRDRVKIDIDFGLNFPVDSDDVDVRDGMPDLDLLLEVGPELELQFTGEPLGGELFLAAQLRGAVSLDGLDPSGRGGIFSLELKHKHPLFSPSTELLTRITPEWGSKDYMDFFYGVASDFATPERTEYRAKSGYLGTKLSFVLKNELTPTFETRIGLRAGFHSGAANRNSPLFTDDTTFGAYAAFLWKFWESKRRVPRPAG